MFWKLVTVETSGNVTDWLETANEDVAISVGSAYTSMFPSDIVMLVLVPDVMHTLWLDNMTPVCETPEHDNFVIADPKASPDGKCCSRCYDVLAWQNGWVGRRLW